MPSTKPHTLFNPGVNTRNARQLRDQATRLREQADINDARARGLEKGKHVKKWSMDSTEFEGFSNDSDEEISG